MSSDNYRVSQNGFHPVQDIQGILDGRITKIVHVKQLPVRSNSFLLCDNEFAYGNITFSSAAKRIKKAEIAAYADSIGLTPDTLTSLWPKRRYYYIYDVSAARFGKRRPISKLTNDAPISKVAHTASKKHIVIDSSNAEDLDRLPYPLKLTMVAME